MKKAVGYCRVSTLYQQDALDTQRYQIKKFARANNYELVELILETGSSKELEGRKGLMKLLKLCKEQEINAVLVSERGRLSKDIFHAGYIEVLLEKYKVDVFGVNQEITDTDEPTRKLIRGLLYLIEEYKFALDRIKCKQGFERKKASGDIFHRAPFGYIRRKGRLFINQEQASIIKRIFQEKLDNIPLSQIAKNVGKLPQTVKYWLENPFYCGFLKNNGALIPAKHEPIISISVWRKLNPDFKIYTHGEIPYSEYPSELFD